MTTFETAPANVADMKVEALALGIKPGLKLSKLGLRVDRSLSGGLRDALQRIRFKGEAGEAAVIPTFGEVGAGIILALGLGAEKPTHEDIRRAAGTAARKTSGYKSVAIELSDGVSGGNQALVEGFLMGSYEFSRYKSKPERPPVGKVLISGSPSPSDIARGEVIADAVNWARDLVNEPSGSRGPAEFAELARKRAEPAGIKVEIYDEKALEKMGMHGILAVGKGSASPPRFMTLTYSPRGAKSFVAAIGKGITFDSGGLSLKTAEGMETMKIDCSGAAAVIAAVAALGELKPKVKVLAAIPLAENMPSGASVKPGDVIKHFGGRTSEVLNTDAEGRLVLADALAWAAAKKPKAMVDFATLTGGMMVALGKKVTGYFANDSRLAKQIADAGQRTGERLWEMPLIDDLRKEIDSEVADIKNTGGRYGSPIFGALFLRDFVGKVPWAHLDIAGPARADKTEHYLTRGATGVGTRLLINWVEARGK